MKLFNSVLIFTLSVIFFACQKKDEIPPILALKDADTLYHVLNSTFKDPGATATDETDGNISSSIYVDNQVNENKVGEYTVTYRVVDQAGNEAKPLTRWVFVKNQGYYYSGLYNTKETQIFPGNENCEYNILVLADSSINFGLSFSNLTCNFGGPAFTQVNDTVIILPYQVLTDTIKSISIQGNGKINDTLMQINYTLTDGDLTELWKATFERQK
jgi:hypothetical protein